ALVVGGPPDAEDGAQLDVRLGKLARDVEDLRRLLLVRTGGVVPEEGELVLAVSDRELIHDAGQPADAAAAAVHDGRGRREVRGVARVRHYSDRVRRIVRVGRQHGGVDVLERRDAHATAQHVERVAL